MSRMDLENRPATLPQHHSDCRSFSRSATRVRSGPQAIPPGQGRPERWITTQQDNLDAGKIEELVCSLRSIQVADPDLAKEILTEAEYFAKNTERMRYPKFREQRLFVGSGVIEGRCKSVIGARFKQSRMFWTVRRANSIFALRCCQMNSEFEFYWESRVA